MTDKRVGVVMLLNFNVKVEDGFGKSAFIYVTFECVVSVTIVTSTALNFTLTLLPTFLSFKKTTHSCTSCLLIRTVNASSIKDIENAFSTADEHTDPSRSFPFSHDGTTMSCAKRKLI